MLRCLDVLRIWSGKQSVTFAACKKSLLGAIADKWCGSESDGKARIARTKALGKSLQYLRIGSKRKGLLLFFTKQ